MNSLKMSLACVEQYRLCTKNCATSRESGGKPAFPTLRLRNSLNRITLKGIHSEITISTPISSEVRKVGLPPLFSPFAKRHEIRAVLVVGRYLISAQAFPSL